MSEDSMQRVTRTVIDAERGVCRAIDHKIIQTDVIDDHPDLEPLRGYYCPTCNKFWRESY